MSFVVVVVVTRKEKARKGEMSLKIYSSRVINTEILYFGKAVIMIKISLYMSFSNCLCIPF